VTIRWTTTDSRLQLTAFDYYNAKMTILLSALGISAAAIFIWIGVRILNRPAASTIWIVGTTLLLFIYPLSFGPACWAMDYFNAGHDTVARMYGPILRAWVYGPAPVSIAIKSYVNIGTKSTWTIEPVDLNWVRIQSNF
jgi:hypothetical protein